MNPMMMQQNVKIPVPEWNLELSFEAWKRSVLNWSRETRLSPSQKINLVVDSLKKNKERTDIKSWIIQSIEEDASFDRNDKDSVDKLLEKMEGKFKVSNWKRAGEIWKDVLEFKQEENETPKKYLERLIILETKLKNANCKISNILLAQHFLQRAKINYISVKNILAKVDTDDEEKVLQQTKENYERLVNNTADSSSKVTTTFYGDSYQRYRDRNHRSRSKSENRRENYRDSNNRGRTRSRSIGFKERGQSRSRSRGREYFKKSFNKRNDNQEHKRSPHTTYQCEKFNLPDCDFNKCSEDLNIFKSKTANKGIVDSGCPKTVMGKLFWSVYRDTLTSS